MQRFSGEKLKQLRGKRNQTDLAAALQRRGFGTTQTQISRWESGQRPRKYILEALAAELRCSVDDLFDDEEEDEDLLAPLMRDVEALLRERLVRA